MARGVLITGGSRGIGAAAVKRFAAGGDRVAFIYAHDDEAAKAVVRETGSAAYKADLACAGEAARVYERIRAERGAPEVLVNCAGVSLISQICDTTDEMLKSLLEVNLCAPYTLCRCASVDMVRGKKGSIINIGSVWGRVGASCETAYSASKGAVRALTMSLAKELAPSGIRVNCVEPGVIETDMNSHLGSEAIRGLCDEIPLGRLGTAEETAELIYFLSGDSAAYITGQVIGADGGFGL